MVYRPQTTAQARYCQPKTSKMSISKKYLHPKKFNKLESETDLEGVSLVGPELQRMQQIYKFVCVFLLCIHSSIKLKVLE